MFIDLGSRSDFQSGRYVLKIVCCLFSNRIVTMMWLEIVEAAFGVKKTADGRVRRA